MAKKTGKPVKDKKKPVKKTAAKAVPKKAAAKPVKKAAPAKKAPAKPAAAAKKVAPAKAAPKAAPAKATGKGLLKAVGKAIASVTSKVAAKPEKPVKTAKPIPEGKVAKVEGKKSKAPVEEAEVEAPAEEELVDEEVVLTDAEGRRYCRVKDCDQLSAVDGYCRYHYLALWKKIQVRKKILSEGKLERYIEELTARYPDKFLEMLRKDLRSEKEFLAAIQELEIDENADNSEFEDEAQNYIDEVRGMEPAARDDEDF